MKPKTKNPKKTPTPPKPAEPAATPPTANASPAAWPFRPAPLVLANSYQAQKLYWAWEQQRQGNPVAVTPTASANPATPGAKGKQGKAKPTGKRGEVGRKEAAQYMGVSVRTLQRWIKEPRTIPDEWAGFSPAVLKTKADWAAWKAGLGTRESGITTVDKAGSQLERGRWHRTGSR